MESPFLEVSHPAYNDLLRTGWTSVGRTRVGLWFAVEKPDDDHSKDDLEDMWKNVEKPWNFWGKPWEKPTVFGGASDVIFLFEELQNLQIH